MEAMRQAISSGDTEAFIEALDQAISAGDRATVRVGMSTLQFLPRAKSRRLYERLRETWPGMVPADHPSFVTGPLAQEELRPSNQLQRLMRRAIDGDLDGAMAEARQAEATWPERFGEPERLYSMLAAMPSRASLPRELVRDRGEEIVASPPGERGTLFVFCGLADRVGLDLTVYDAFLAKAGLGGVYLRDHSRSLYLKGIESIEGGREGFGTHLRALVAAAAGPVAFLGNSAGGLGAVDWACELGVRRVLCFSTPTTIRLDRLREYGDNRCSLLMAHLAQTGIALDLPERLATKGFDGSLHLVYGADMPVDRAHAQALAGVPGVTLEPLPGVAIHNVAMAMAWSGQLVERLEAI